MIILRATADVLRVVTSAIADIEVHVSAMEADNAVPPVIQDIVRSNIASIVTATTTTILDCTTVNRRRNVRHINIYNNHATTACQVDVEHTDGTNAEVLASVSLLAGETLVFTQDGVWQHFTVDGALYSSVGNAATQADMEAATETKKYATPQNFNWHPGTNKCWGHVIGAGAPVLAAGFNIASIADTAAGRLGITIGVDFSSANYSIVSQIERGGTALGETAVEQSAIRNASPAAGVFELESYDHTVTTLAADDPNSTFFMCAGDQA